MDSAPNALQLHSPLSDVWFLLVDANGDPFMRSSASKVKLPPNSDVVDFCKAVKAKCSNTLAHCEAYRLEVYENKDAFAEKITLRSSSRLDGMGTTIDEALIVVAPSKSLSIPSILDYRPPPAEWSHSSSSRTENSATEARSPPCPRTDDLILRPWTDFEPACREFIADTVESNPKMRSRLNVPPMLESEMLPEITSERNICDCLVKLGSGLRSVSKACWIQSTLNSVKLNPDMVLLERNRPNVVVLAVIKVETPWAISIGGDLISAYEKQIAGLERVAGDGLESRNKIDCNIVCAVVQLWANMTVNHLRHGVLSIYNETVFFRRGGKITVDGVEKILLEVSPVVSLSSEESLPLFSAWLFFSHCAKRDTYFTITTMPQKTPPNRFTPMEFSFGEIRLVRPGEFCDQPTRLVKAVMSDAAGDNVTVLVKMKDALKDKDKPHQRFLVEVKVYSLLDNTTVAQSIPKFYGCGVASGMIYCIFLEPCGTEVDEDADMKPYADKLREIVHQLHEAGVVHGDLAHRNLVLDKQRVRVIDFNHAKLHRRHRRVEGDDIADEFWLDGSAWDRAVAKDLVDLKDIISNSN